MSDNVRNIESARDAARSEAVTITITLHSEHREIISLWRKKRREHGESHSERDALLHFLFNGMDHWIRGERFVAGLQAIKDNHEKRIEESHDE